MRLSNVLPELQALELAGVLEPIDVHFAATMGACVKEDRAEVLLAAALVSRRTREGHVCVPLEEVAGRPFTSETDVVGSWPEWTVWQASLRGSKLVSAGDSRAPLVFTAAGRLYLHKFWEHERELAALLRARAGAVASTYEPHAVRAGLARLFGTPEGAPLDDQQTAVLVALVQRFAIISGGPGTGKTSTVARLLALLVELALGAGETVPRILLLAPTGKAAGRLVESIRLAKGRLDAAPTVLTALPEEARTIHRALGVRRGTSSYWHDRTRPLVADLVLVDEASMVDLALMRHLLEAVPVGARLILLGDRHQLTSVEAGSVLSELCAAAALSKAGGATSSPLEPAGYGPGLCDAVEQLTGRSPPRAPGPTPLLRDHVVELKKSYRFDATSPIGRLAAAVREGDEAGVFRVLEAGGDAAWFEEPPTQELSRALETRLVAGLRPVLTASDPAQALRALMGFRVLCAHRQGWAGVAHLNEKIRHALGTAGLVDERAEFFSGRPVLVTQNDYSVGLFNGDVGLAWGSAGAIKVHFEASASADGSAGTRPISPARLPAHETAFAMSVHKSQGSEHDEVVVILPEAESPLLSRELLYTAITRAKGRVRLFGTRQAIQQALRRQVARASGLAEELQSGEQR